MTTGLDRPIVAWLLCLALSPSLTAGEDSFKVAARDRNGKPVPGVTLSVLSGGNKFSAGVTDENGRHDVPIDLGSIPPGQSIQVVVRKCRHMDGGETTEVFFLSPGSQLPPAKNCDDHAAGFFSSPQASETLVSIDTDNSTVVVTAATPAHAAVAPSPAGATTIPASTGPPPPAYDITKDLVPSDPEGKVAPKTEANPHPYLQFQFKDVKITSVTTSGASEPPTETVTTPYPKIEYNYSDKPVKKGKQPQAIEFTVSEVAQQSPSDERGLDVSFHHPAPDHHGSGHRANPYLQPAAFHSGSAPQAPPPGTWVRLLPHSQSGAQAAPPAAAPISFSFIANGNPSGEAFELRIVDPSGKLHEIRAPDGLILEPLERGSVKPVSAAPGERLVSRKLNAYCVKYDEDPPEPDAVYRVAAPQIQEQYKPVRAVIRAGRELAAAGKFHSDSDPADYIISIRQYALWTRLENWNEEKFAEVFREKTRQIAEQSKVQWTKELDDALRALVPGRWRDISLVLEEAQKIEAAERSSQ